MWDPDAGSALPLLNKFTFDKSDFDGWCPETGSSPGYPQPGNGESSITDGAIIGGYTSTDLNDGLEKTHFCNSAFNYPALTAIACADLSAYPDYTMESLARIMLHEFTHYAAVGSSAGTSQIENGENLDNLAAYGPSRCHGLVDVNQDDFMVEAMINADSYAWMAANACFANICSGTPNPTPNPPPNNGNYDDPPNYVLGQPGR